MKKFKLDRRCVFFSIVSLLIVSLFAFGSASWTMAITKDFDAGTINKVDLDEGKVVAYINDNTEANQYRSVEQALAKAKELGGGEVYVIPGTNPTIKVDCEVASGVKLILPYKDKEYHIADYSAYKDDQSAILNDYFADSTLDGVAKYRKNTLFIKDGVKITNNGSIFIGGILGIGNQTRIPTGQVVKDYCEINMGKGSSIINNNLIETYGYIKESSDSSSATKGQVVNSTNASLKCPFVIYDFKGGTYSSGCVGRNVMPFSIYDFPNVQVKNVFKPSSKLIGMALAYALSKVNSGEATIIGDDGLFRLSTGTITLDYESIVKGCTIVDTGASRTTRDKISTTKIIVDGDMAFSTLSVNIGVEIDTKKMFCPISYKLNIEIKSGTTKMNNKAKFLVGSILKVDSGATIEFNSAASFYRNYIPLIETGYSNASYYPRLDGAVLENNGRVKLNSNFGGLITTKSESSVIITGSGYSNSVDTTEILTSSTGGLSASEDDHTEKARATFSNDNGINVKYGIVPSGTHSSLKNGTIFYWALNNIDAKLNVKINLNGYLKYIFPSSYCYLPVFDFYTNSTGTGTGDKNANLSNSQERVANTLSTSKTINGSMASSCYFKISSVSECDAISTNTSLISIAFGKWIFTDWDFTVNITANK